MHRLIPTSRPLLSSMASAPLHWWRLPLMAASNSPVRRVSRFHHGFQNKASSSGVRGDEESGKQDSRQHIVPSAKDRDTMISQCQHAQHMTNVENSGTTKELNNRHGYSAEEDGSVKCLCGTWERSSMDIVSGDEEAHRTTMDDTDDEEERWESFKRLCATMRRLRRSSLDIVSGDEEAHQTTTDVTDDEEERLETWWEFWDDVLDQDLEKRAASARQGRAALERAALEGRVVHLNILPDSSHRDGSVYREDTHEWKKEYRIADRTETRLEAMMLSNPKNCHMYDGTCMRHYPRHMLQIFSLKVAKIPVDAGKVELYGYIAVRDDLEPFLNYIVNISRDDPFAVEQGSLLNMAPKRGIRLDTATLIEYDMRIKTGEEEKDDLQLIDGISVVGLMGTWNCSVFTSRIVGDCGAVDISGSRLDIAVEGTIEVTVSEVQIGSFGMRLGCFISGLDKEIRLFDGTIGEPRGLGRHVVAVVLDTQMDLRLKVVGAAADQSSGGCSESEHCCSFMAHQHGHADRVIKTNFASFLVKVTWSVLPPGKHLGATSKEKIMAEAYG